MRAWDGSMDTDSAAATIAVFSRDKLEELLLQPKLGDDWKGYKWFMSPVWLENVLTHQPPRWLPQITPATTQLLDRRRRGRSERRQRYTFASHVEVGAGASGGHQASLLEPLPYPEERRRHRQHAALRR